MSVRIDQIQDYFRAAGFQWQEHIFNDSKVHLGDCMIELTQNTSPHAFSSYPRAKDSVGWGRFARLQCWEMAYDWLLLHNLRVKCNFQMEEDDGCFPNQFESVGGNYV